MRQRYRFIAQLEISMIESKMCFSLIKSICPPTDQVYPKVYYSN